jgi:hypothetical protein
MKKFILFFSVIFCLTTVTKAQKEIKGKSPEERAKIQTEWMQKKLSLDSTVVPMVQAINLKYANKMQNLINSGDSRYSKLQKFKSLPNQKDKELKAVFTPDQYNLYLKRKEEMKDYLKQNIRENRRDK